MKLTKQGIEFIVTEETGGRKYYENVYKKAFIWPGGASGATAMVGIDIGYYSAQEVNAIFKSLTTPEELELIQEGRGKKGLIAKAYVKKYLSKITFSWEEAIQTFETFILPKFLKYTLSTFPGVDKLCSDTQTALVSLVFNRGTSMKGATRKEMRELRKYVPHADYESIAAQIKSMKRLWDKDSGLVGRRDREAKLVENCLKH